MSLSNQTETDILLLIFNANTWANVAINATSSPLTNLYVSLHTADPGEAGTQSTNEVGYGSYGRVAVARTSGGWTVTGNSVSPAATVTFPAGTAGTSPVATYAAVGALVSGAGRIIASGPLSPSITCGNGITPSLTTASLALTLD